MMDVIVIVVVCAAFGLTVSEAKTEIDHNVFTHKGGAGGSAIFSVEAAGQVYNQTNEFIYLAGNVNHNVDLSIKVDRHIRNAWCSFRKYTLELHDLLSEHSPRAQNSVAKSRGFRDNAIRLRHVEPARVPLRHAVLSPPRTAS